MLWDKKGLSENYFVQQLMLGTKINFLHNRESPTDQANVPDL